MLFDRVLYLSYAKNSLLTTEYCIKHRKEEIAVQKKWVAIAAAAVLVTAFLLSGWNGSQAQEGKLHNCPQPGKWAISVWAGEDRIETGQAIATCESVYIDAAYYLDSNSQNWLRYFPNHPEFNTLLTLNNLQGIITLGHYIEPTPTPTPTPDPLVYLHNQQIVFVASEYGKEDSLWVVNADGTNARQLITNMDYLSILQPKWAPDGEKIAFIKKWSGVWGGHLTILDSSGQILNVIKEDIVDFSWAPDGKSVIYSIKYDGIYRFDVQTKQTQQILITSPGTYDHNPVWSPDGSKIAFVHHEWENNFYISLINFDPKRVPYSGEDIYNNSRNSEIKVITSGESTYDEDLHPQWTSDGKKLVLYSLADSGTIYITDVAKKLVIEISLEDQGLSLEYWWRSEPVELSPNGREIAFVSGRSLYLIDIDGTNIRKVVEAKLNVSYPDWSADSRYIAVTMTPYMYVVSRDGNELYTLSEVAGDKIYSFLDWSP